MAFDLIAATAMTTGLISLLIYAIPFLGLFQKYSSSADKVSADTLNARRSYDAFYKYKDVKPFSMAVTHPVPNVLIPRNYEELHYKLKFPNNLFFQKDFPIKNSWMLKAPNAWGNDTFKDTYSTKFKINK